MKKEKTINLGLWSVLIYLVAAYYCGFQALNGSRFCELGYGEGCSEQSLDMVVKGFTWLLSPFWALLWKVGSLMS